MIIKRKLTDMPSEEGIDFLYMEPKKTEIEDLLNQMDKEGYFLREADIERCTFIFELYPTLTERNEHS